MKNLMVAPGKRFEDPSTETMASIAFAIVWDNSGFGSRNERVISPYKWTISSSVNAFHLRDSRGEVRPIRWGDYSPSIECSDWAAYDADQQKNEVIELKNEILKLRKQAEASAYDADQQKQETSFLRETLEKVFDVNESAGPGSRKKVRTILVEAGIFPCDDCEKAVCVCHDHEDYDD